MQVASSHCWYQWQQQQWSSDDFFVRFYSYLFLILFVLTGGAIFFTSQYPCRIIKQEESSWLQDWCAHSCCFVSFGHITLFIFDWCIYLLLQSCFQCLQHAGFYFFTLKVVSILFVMCFVLICISVLLWKLSMNWFVGCHKFCIIKLS